MRNPLIKSLFLFLALCFCLSSFAVEKPKLNISKTKEGHITINTQARQGSYCCSWDNGTKCYAYKCKSCGCMGGKVTSRGIIAK